MAQPKRSGRPPRDEDDEDDDIPPRVGRPRSPEQYGPPKPEPHEREEYFDRLQRILDALEIGELGRDVRLYLQKVLRRRDLLRAVDAKGFPEEGDAVVTLLLRSIAESSNGPSALTLPIIDAVRSCPHDVWTNRGLAWLEAMDKVPLLATQRALHDLGLERHLSDAISHKLTQLLGPPIVPQPAPKKKSPAKRLVKPPDVSQATWDAVVAMRKKSKRPRAARMAA
jgi:hypothetical protein